MSRRRTGAAWPIWTRAAKHPRIRDDTGVVACLLRRLARAGTADPVPGQEYSGVFALEDEDGQVEKTQALSWRTTFAVSRAQGSSTGRRRNMWPQSWFHLLQIARLMVRRRGQPEGARTTSARAPLRGVLGRVHGKGRLSGRLGNGYDNTRWQVSRSHRFQKPFPLICPLSGRDLITVGRKRWRCDSHGRGGAPWTLAVARCKVFLETPLAANKQHLLEQLLEVSGAVSHHQDQDRTLPLPEDPGATSTSPSSRQGADRSLALGTSRVGPIWP